MLKQLGICGAGVAVTALAAGLVLPAMGSSDAQDDDEDRRVISLVSVNTEEDFVNVGPNRLSLGDQFIFASNLFKQGEKVGHTGVVCTITSVAREESQCSGTADLGHGQIAIQGLLAGQPESFVFPITGGSGKFKEAGGELRVRELSETRERLTFLVSDSTTHLLNPR